MFGRAGYSPSGLRSRGENGPSGQRLQHSSRPQAQACVSSGIKLFTAGLCSREPQCCGADHTGGSASTLSSDPQSCPLHKVPVAFLLGGKHFVTPPGAATALHVHWNVHSQRLPARARRPHWGEDGRETDSTYPVPGQSVLQQRPVPARCRTYEDLPVRTTAHEVQTSYSVIPFGQPG